MIAITTRSSINVNTPKHDDKGPAQGLGDTPAPVVDLYVFVPL
jgi:hypothetical protein